MSELVMQQDPLPPQRPRGFDVLLESGGSFAIGRIGRLVVRLRKRLSSNGVGFTVSVDGDDEGDRVDRPAA